MKTPQEVFEIINSHIVNKTPFSLIRLGDGEGIVLNKNHVQHQQFFNFLTTRQWGYTVSDADEKSTCNMLEESIANCSLLGIPTWHCGHPYADQHGFWQYIVTYVNDKKLSIDMCSIDINSMLLEQGLLDNIITSVDTIRCISCHDLTEGFSRKFPSIKTVFYKIPGEKFFFNSEDRHYPERFTEILNIISSENQKGNIWLVGGGILGKIYCNAIKNSGGIALDIGHIFDNWAGYVTRGCNKTSNDKI